MSSKLYSSIVFFLFFTTINYGQEKDPCDCDTINSVQRLIGDVFYNPTDIVGSQFYMDKWLSGEIFLTNGTVLFNPYQKYNGYIDNLVYLVPSTLQQVVTDKDILVGFNLIDEKTMQKFNFTKIKVKKELKQDSDYIFVEILYEKNIALFAYRRILKQESNGSDRANYYKDEYIPSCIYYLKIPGRKLYEFKTLKSKHLFSWFPDQSSMIRKALKENKIKSMKREEDLIKVTEIINPIFH